MRWNPFIIDRRMSPLSSQAWQGSLSHVDWNIYVRWLAFANLFILGRPLSLFVKNGLREVLPPWDPIWLFSALPAFSAELTIVTLAVAFGLSIGVLGLGPQKNLLRALCLFNFLSLGLLHSIKYLHHRDGFWTLVWIIVAFYSSGKGTRQSIAPLLAICVLWSLLFSSAALQKLISPDLVLMDPQWFLRSAQALNVYGWSVNQGFFRFMVWLSKTSLALVPNVFIFVLEALSAVYLMRGSWIWGAPGVLLIVIFKLTLGIVFWEILAVAPAWILLARHSRTGR